MEKTTLPEISKWVKRNDGCMFHIFSYGNETEKEKILNTLERFVKNHSNYYICNEEERIVLVKEEICQAT